jgi:hypothetical protein
MGLVPSFSINSNKMLFSAIFAIIRPCHKDSQNLKVAEMRTCWLLALVAASHAFVARPAACRARSGAVLAMSDRQELAFPLRPPPLFDPPSESADAASARWPEKLALGSTGAGAALLLGLAVLAGGAREPRAASSLPQFEELGDFPAAVYCRQPFGDITPCGPVS